VGRGGGGEEGGGLFVCARVCTSQLLSFVMHARMCTSVPARSRVLIRVFVSMLVFMCVCMYVCVFVHERGREIEGVSVCVSVCM